MSTESMTDDNRHPDDHPYADYDEDDPVDSPEGYEYHTEPGRDIWRHRETGLKVTVAKHRRPTQMHTPETSRDDTGYRVEVRGGPENVAEPISADDLGHKGPQRENAAEFMAAFPDGEYVPEIPDNPWKRGTVRWRDVAGEEDDR